MNPRAEVVKVLTSGRPMLTLGGTETFLLFVQSFPLREFAAFEVFADDDAFSRLEREFLRPTADAALEHGMGLLVDCLVWRASPDFLAKLGYPASDLARLNELAVARMERFVDDWRTTAGARATELPVVLAAEIGPRGDGYTIDGDGPVSIDAAREYHGRQLGALAGTAVHIATALTMTSVDEAIGIVLAARDHGLPIIVSATVETDGRLPDGSGLGEFVERVDRDTDGHALFFMANCAHPTHVESTLAAAAETSAPWLRRFRGLRANASTKSHEELDASTELDAGDPDDLGKRMAELRTRYELSILGGCCGTDASHIGAIARGCRKGGRARVAPARA